LQSYHAEAHDPGSDSEGCEQDDADDLSETRRSKRTNATNHKSDKRERAKEEITDSADTGVHRRFLGIELLTAQRFGSPAAVKVHRPSGAAGVRPASSLCIEKPIEPRPQYAIA
jgi:hypothetical protein